ncbi:hypothetical protein [Streptomyces sp. NPDC059262]
MLPAPTGSSRGVGGALLVVTPVAIGAAYVREKLKKGPAWGL